MEGGGNAIERWKGQVVVRDLSLNIVIPLVNCHKISSIVRLSVFERSKLRISSSTPARCAVSDFTPPV